MAQVTQQCQDMTAEITVSSVFDEITTLIPVQHQFNSRWQCTVQLVI